MGSWAAPGSKASRRSHNVDVVILYIRFPLWDHCICMVGNINSYYPSTFILLISSFLSSSSFSWVFPVFTLFFPFFRPPHLPGSYLYPPPLSRWYSQHPWSLPFSSCQPPYYHGVSVFIFLASCPCLLILCAFPSCFHFH